jgi:small subunit ribosomal protein S20
VPNIKSAIKRVEIAERNRQRNVVYKSIVRTTSKKYFTRLGEYAAAPSDAALGEVQALLNLAFSKVDKAVRSGAIHANNGARKKARLSAALARAQSQGNARAS